MNRPTSVTRVVQLVWVLVLMATAVAVLAVVFNDELVATWAGNRGYALDDSRVPPSFTPVIVTLYVVVIVLGLILLSFVVGGHNWARHSLAALVILCAIATIGGIRTGPPAVFVVFGILGLVLETLLVVCLWHRGTTTYVTQLRVRPARNKATGA